MHDRRHEPEAPPAAVIRFRSSSKRFKRGGIIRPGLKLSLIIRVTVRLSRLLILLSARLMPARNKNPPRSPVFFYHNNAKKPSGRRLLTGRANFDPEFAVVLRAPRF